MCRKKKQKPEAQIHNLLKGCSFNGDRGDEKKGQDNIFFLLSSCDQGKSLG